MSAFFAWLGFTPLQSENLLEGLEGGFLRRGRRNLYVVNNYFLVSFVFYASAAIGDYLVNSQTDYWLGLVNPYRHFWLLYIIVGLCFLIGVVTLVAPILYMNPILKGDKTVDSINPAGAGYALGMCASVLINLVITLGSIMITSHLVVKVFVAVMGCVSVLSGFMLMKYWASPRWKLRIGDLLVCGPCISFVLLAASNILW